MSKGILAVLCVVCFALQAWAQAPQPQVPPEQASVAGQKTPDQSSGTDQTAPAAGATTEKTTQSVLEEFQNFSAIQNGGPLPGLDEDRYIYRSGNLMRMQGDAAIPNYYVTDLTKQKSHFVTANACLAEDTPYVRSFPFALSRPGVTYERTPIGEETVDGHQCRVEDLVIHNPKNPVVMHFRLYEAEDLQGFPIKIENRREHAWPWVIHYKDVRLGPQDPSLFIVPEQCQSSNEFKKITPSAKPKSAAPAKSQ
ncbi:MAG: hypothetical protein WCC78_04990 [Terriglobales bacterium]